MASRPRPKTPPAALIKQQQIERAKYRHWHVDVPAGRALGVSVVKSTAGAIAGAEVRALAPLGSGAFVVEWNMRCDHTFPDDAINIGDVIVCANWVINPDGIWEVLKAQGHERLLILARRAEASAIASSPPWSPAVSQVSRPRDIGIAQVAQALRASAALREARGISRHWHSGPPPGPPLQRPAAMGAMVCPLQGRYGLPPAGPPPALPQAPRLGLRAEAPLFVPGQLWPPWIPPAELLGRTGETPAGGAVKQITVRG